MGPRPRPGMMPPRPGMTRSPFIVDPVELQKNKLLFKEYDDANTGFIEGTVAAEYLTQSGLPQSILNKIWELADPVVSPAYTAGLEGQPNEVKLKYLADNDFAHLSGDALKEAISEYIRKKDSDLVGQMVSQGTTPRRLTDLIGSLCDLTSGSGDKGTPIVFIQGYFDNYTEE